MAIEQLNMCTPVQSPHRQSELSYIPEQHGAGQGGENIPYAGSLIAILQPALFNRPPQLVAKSETFRPFRFPRSDPLQDRMDSQNIRRELGVWMVSA